jgi:hypothetical protein
MEHGDGDKLLEPIQSENVRRDNKGRVVKGSRLNPSGLDRRKAKMLRDLESLTPRAIAALGRLMEGDNPAAALGAAKEVLDRNLGKVKQTVSFDVTQTHVLHLQALEELAQRKRAQLESPGNPANIALDHLRQGQLIEGELVENHLIEPINCQEIDSVNNLTCQTIDTPPAGESRGAAAFAPSTPHTDEILITPSPLPSDESDDADAKK